MQPQQHRRLDLASRELQRRPSTGGSSPSAAPKDRTQSRTQSVGCSRFFWYRLVAAPVLQERKGSSSSSQPHDHSNWCSHSSTGGLVWPVGSSRDVPQRITRFQWKQPQCCRKNRTHKTQHNSVSRVQQRCFVAGGGRPCAAPCNTQEVGLRHKHTCSLVESV